MQGSYPKREPFFIAKFLQALSEQRIAAELGPNVTVMLVIVVTAEDRNRYRGPALLFCEELQSRAGIASRSTFKKCRDAAVAAGWLSFRAGERRRPSSYFVCIPSQREPSAEADLDSVDVQKLNVNSRGGTAVDVQKLNVNSTADPAELPLTSKNCAVEVQSMSRKWTQDDGALFSSRARAPYPVPEEVRDTSSSSSESAHRAQANRAEPAAVVVKTFEVDLIRRVADAGVADASGCVMQARGRGLTDAEIVAIVEHFQSSPGRWDARALHARIAKLSAPGAPADTGWPPPRAEWVTAQNDARRQRELQQQLGEHRSSERKNADEAVATYRTEYERFRAMSEIEQERCVRELLGATFARENRTSVAFARNARAIPAILRAMHDAESSDVASAALVLSSQLAIDSSNVGVPA